jgi:hypothetical protein
MGLKDFAYTKEHMHDAVREQGYRFEEITADWPYQEDGLRPACLLKLRKA